MALESMRLLVAIAAVLTLSGHAAHATDQADSSRLLRRVKPFSEGLLPCPLGNLPCGSKRYLKTFDAPALGRVMSLNMHSGTKPKSSSDMKTLFHIYTGRKDTHAITFQPRSPSSQLSQQAFGMLRPELDFQYDLRQMAESGFDASKRTVVMIPGYVSLEEAEWAHAATEYWLQLLGEHVNVIVVGWPDSNGPLYENAVANGPLVARQITIFLHYLAQLGGTSLKSQRFLDRLYLVGHSIGAHIAGYVGKDLGGRAGRITGLDPAGPMFDTLPLDQRLDRGDARLVDVLHTNAGDMKYTGAFLGMFTSTIPSLLANSARGQGGVFYGTNLQLGHIDFYANNGRTQDGCTGALHSCDHLRSSAIYIDLLRRELYLQTMGSRRSHIFHKQNRVWAFRADDFDGFTRGVKFTQLCPQLVDAEAHLNNTLVRQTFGQCAAPLLDLVTPVNGLIRELRDKYHVDFEPEARSEKQPRFYFRTIPASPKESSQVIGDQHLLKLYLQPHANHWDPLLCSLQMNITMDVDASEEVLTVEINQLERGQTIVATPFAHPAGPRAHAQLTSLLAMAHNGERDSEKFALLFRDLFPHEISLAFTRAVDSAASGVPISGCQLAIQQVEVAPVSVYTAGNIGALYEHKKELPSDEQLTFVSARELGERVGAAAGPPSDKLSLANRYELRLGSVLMES